MGPTDKKEITDPRFFDGVTSFIPDIGDCQMLFLANNTSRMKNTHLGTHIVEVHNGSSLFTGNAGGGESNLRRYIIENDLLEAIIAMPEKDFYNTGISTYIWIITNRKEQRRKGYVQLIDASNICSPLRKNLGEKNCETTDDDRRRIPQLLMDFKETPESKIFRNEEFGYWQVPVLRPKRNKEGNIVMKKGKPVMACNKKESEQIPLLYPGGIEAFYEKEVKPYDAEAQFDAPVIGYELSFTKYFYKPVQLRTLDAIMEDIRAIERDTDGLLDNIDFDKYRIVKEEERAIVLKNEDTSVKPIPVGTGGGKPQPEMDALSSIVKDFNDTYGNIEWKNCDEVQRQIEELPARIATSVNFVNAVRNGDRQVAQITFNDDIINIVAGMLEEKTEFVQTYFTNQDFQNFVNARVFQAAVSQLSNA